MCLCVTRQNIQCETHLVRLQSHRAIYYSYFAAFHSSWKQTTWMLQNHNHKPKTISLPLIAIHWSWEAWKSQQPFELVTKEAIPKTSQESVIEQPKEIFYSTNRQTLLICNAWSTIHTIPTPWGTPYSRTWVRWWFQVESWGIRS